MRIGVVGLGLIGGSLARSIRAHSSHAILGWDRAPEVVSAAIADGTLNAAGGVLVHQCGEAVRVVICACRAGAWGFVWHRTFSLSRAQSRTCSGCAEARKGARM